MSATNFKKYLLKTGKIITTISSIISILFGLFLLLPIMMNYSLRANISFLLLSLFFIVNGSLYIHYKYFTHQVSNDTYIRITLITVVFVLLSIAIFPFSIFESVDKSSQIMIEEQRVEEQFLQEVETSQQLESSLNNNDNDDRKDIKQVK